MKVGFIGDGVLPKEAFEFILEEIKIYGVQADSICLNASYEFGKSVLSYAKEKNLKVIALNEFSNEEFEDFKRDYDRNKQIIKLSDAVITFESLNVGDATKNAMRYMTRKKKSFFRLKEDKQNRIYIY